LLLTLKLPRINPYTNTALVSKIYAAEGVSLNVGAKLLDLTVDLSATAPHDCPPVSHYRVALRDRAWLRRLTVALGDNVEVGATMAQFTTEPDEPFDGEPVRAVRVTIAGILDQSDWLSVDRS
jgi:hypothetical protein